MIFQNWQNTSSIGYVYQCVLRTVQNLHRIQSCAMLRPWQIDWHHEDGVECGAKEFAEFRAKVVPRNAIVQTAEMVGQN